MSFLLDPFTSTFMVRALLGGVLVAALCGVVGTWVVVRGMAFLGEAMAHGVLPGVAFAALIGLPAVVGAAVSATVMTAGVSVVSRRGKLSHDTSIGLLFVAMLSLGVLIVSHSRSFATDLTAILFGDVLAIGSTDVVLLVIAVVAVVLVCAVFHRSFVAETFDARLAQTLGLRPKLAQPVLVGLVTVVVVASYQAVGSLLVVGLLLAPAVAAGRWVRSIPATMTLAVIFGAAAVLSGLIVSWYAATAAGASIAMSAIGLAALSAAVAAAVRVSRRAVVRRSLAAGALVAVLGVSACSSPSPSDAGSGDTASSNAGSTETGTGGHGHIDGAAEMQEPQLRLVTLDGEGRLAAFDPATEKTVELADDIPQGSTLSADARFAFLADPAGVVSIVDTGTWTVPHGDHSHYYLAKPRALGEVRATGKAASGPVVVTSSTALTALLFTGDGSGVLIDSKSLADGTVRETARIEGSHAGALVPLGDGALVGTGVGTDGFATQVQQIAADGTAIGVPGSCPALRGSASSRVGVVFGCADGVLLATEGEAGAKEVSYERIAYPDGTAEADRAFSFAARPGRPALASVAGDRGAWLVDTRARSMTLLASATPLLRATAVGDSDGTVVAIDSAGRIVVLGPDGQLGQSEPILADDLVDGRLPGAVALEVDASRAYVNSPAGGLVYEIDYGDSARISRSLDVEGDAAMLAEVGR